MCRNLVGNGLTLTQVHGVVVNILMAHRHELESLVDALSGDQSIRRGDSRNNVLGDTHGQFVGDSLNIELFCTFEGSLEDPLLIFRTVFVHSSVFVSWLSQLSGVLFLSPLDFRGV